MERSKRERLFNIVRFLTEPTLSSETEVRISPIMAGEAIVTDSALILDANGEWVRELHKAAPELSPNPSPQLNIDKLAYCVAIAETGDCTAGMGVTKNNCFGIMTWPNGVRTGKWYETKEQSYTDFKRIWLKSYKTFPTYSMAAKWTGNDNTQRWLNTVTNCYNKN